MQILALQSFTFIYVVYITFGYFNFLALCIGLNWAGRCNSEQAVTPARVEGKVR